MNPIVLPTERSEIDTRWIAQKFGMIGQPGVGKSEFWSHAKALYIQTEAGLNHLKVMKLPVRSWEELEAVYAALLQAYLKDKSLPYDTIVVDTIDKLVDLADEQTLERGHAKFKGEFGSIGDLPNGVGWAWRQDLVENILNKLEELPCAIVYVGHLELKEVKSPTASIHKQTISIGGKLGGMLTAWPDHLLALQASYQGQNLKRIIRTKPSSTLDAKSRGGMVKDGTEWGDDSAKNFSEFRGLFT